MADSLVEGLSAGLGGIVSASILYPMELVKNKMQCQQEGDDGIQDKNMTACARRVASTSGLAGFYQGVEWSASGSFVEKTLYFISYNFLTRQVALFQGVTELGTFSRLLVGAAAEWCQLPFYLPFDTVMVKMQADETGKLTVGQIVKDMRASKTGLRGFWIPQIWAYVVLSCKPAIQFAIFERLKSALLRKRSVSNRRSAMVLTAFQAFFIGAIARAVATILTFPYNRAKCILQASSSTCTSCPSSIVADGESTTANLKKKPTSSIFGVILATIFSKGGVRALYKGLVPDLARGVLSAALMLTVKEKMQAALRSLLVSHTQ